MCRENHKKFLSIMPAERFIVLASKFADSTLTGEAYQNLHNFFTRKFMGE